MSLQVKRTGCLNDRPDAVIFDTDNTLYAYEPAHQAATEAAEKRAEKLMGVSIASFRESFDLARQQVKRQLGKTASGHSRLLYFQKTLEQLGMKTQLLMTLDLEQTYWRSFLHASQLFPEVRELILDLRSCKIKTAILTDLTAQIQFRKLIYFGLDDVFDYVITSEEAGADKPAQAPFLLALDKLRVDAGKCWMVGDSAESDIRGGRSMGMTTLQKRHGGVAIGDGESAPDVIFDSFHDLREMVNGKGWGQVFDKDHA